MAIVPPDISVVVTTYNDPESLFRCLESIPESVEIVVSDDGTEPPLNDRLPEKVDHYLWQEDKGNRASSARNNGAGLVTRPKVLFLDDDVVLHPMALAAHSICLSMYDVSMGLLPNEKWVPYSDDRLLFYIKDDEAGWNYCWSGNLAVRKPSFASVGGFDAELYNGGHGYEDIDLGRTMYEAGCRFHLNRLAMAWHPETQAAYKEEVSDLVIANQRKFEGKWGDSLVVPGKMG